MLTGQLSQPADRLFTYYARTLDAAACEALATADADLEGRIGLPALFRRIPALFALHPTAFLEELTGPSRPQAECVPFLLYWYVDESAFLADELGIASFRERLLERMGCVEVVCALLDVKRARCDLRNERHESGRERLLTALIAVEHRRHCVQADLLRARAYQHVASAFLEQGQLAFAADYLEQSQRLCTRWRFADQHRLSLAHGELARAEGRFAAAVTLFQNPAARRFYREFDQVRWLVASHVGAARAALDAGKLGTAEAELQSVERLLEADRRCTPADRGQFLTQKARLCWAEGQRMQAWAHLERARGAFLSPERPRPSGLRDVHITEAEQALLEGDLGGFLQHLDELLSTACKIGSLPVTTRRLLLRALLHTGSGQGPGLTLAPLGVRLGQLHSPRVLRAAIDHIDRLARRELGWERSADQRARVAQLLSHSCFQPAHERYRREPASLELAERIDSILSRVP